LSCIFHFSYINELYCLMSSKQVARWVMNSDV